MAYGRVVLPVKVDMSMWTVKQFYCWTVSPAMRNDGQGARFGAKFRWTCSQCRIFDVRVFIPFYCTS